MGTKGHPIHSFYYLGIAFLLKLVVLSKELQEMGKALLFVLQHHALQFSLEIKFLENGTAFDGARLSHLLSKLLLMQGHLLGRELNAE